MSVNKRQFLFLLLLFFFFTNINENTVCKLSMEIWPVIFLPERLIRSCHCIIVLDTNHDILFSQFFPLDWHSNQGCTSSLPSMRYHSTWFPTSWTFQLELCHVSISPYIVVTYALLMSWKLWIQHDITYLIWFLF